MFFLLEVLVLFVWTLVCYIYNLCKFYVESILQADILDSNNTDTCCVYIDDVVRDRYCIPIIYVKFNFDIMI